MKSKNMLFLILIIGIIGISVIYFYADSQVTNAINEVHSSLESLDYRIDDFSLIPPSITMAYTYRLENPTKIDIYYTYYAEIYYEDNYLSTIEFETLVPSERSVTVETEANFGVDAVAIVEDLIFQSEIEYHYVGSFTGKGTLLFTISKSWIDEWDWTFSQ